MWLEKSRKGRSHVFWHGPRLSHEGVCPGKAEWKVVLNLVTSSVAALASHEHWNLWLRSPLSSCFPMLCSSIRTVSSSLLEVQTEVGPEHWVFPWVLAWWSYQLLFVTLILGKQEEDPKGVGETMLFDKLEKTKTTHWSIFQKRHISKTWHHMRTKWRYQLLENDTNYFYDYCLYNFLLKEQFSKVQGEKSQ